MIWRYPVNQPVPAAVPSGLPDPEHHLRLARLENEITELAAHINAATFRLLVLINEYDEQDGWWQHGVASCAHWLQWQCGTTIGVAREKVRVARALPNLPKISKSFSKGRISYSKVRAMTRVATPKNEKFLLKIAKHGTAAHVETVVRNYRRGKRLEILYEENNRHAHRELSWYMDGDGMWVFKGKFTAEQGALIAKALEGAMGELFEEQQNEPSDVSAETSRRMACDASVVHWHEGKDSEPLNIGRKSRTIPPSIRRALKRRDHGCRFPGCSCSRFVDAHHITHWADGGETCVDNLVLLCRRHHRLVHEGGFGVHSETCGDIRFSFPDGRTMAAGPDGRFRGNVVSITRKNRKNGLDITSETLPPMWTGETMDYDLAILGLQSRE